jgi:uroporphyrinogen-III synthase
MHILVTRPEPDATEMRLRLEAMGHRVSVSPLLRIAFRGDVPVDVKGVSAVVVTSRNGLRALMQRPQCAECLALPIFTVGPGTGAMAREAHFTTVIEGHASARELIDVIVRHAAARCGTLLIVRPDEPAFDVSGALRERGFPVRDVALYRSIPEGSLDPAVAAAIETGDMDAVALMSARSAAAFARLIENAGLAAAARKLAYLCLSEAVAGPLKPLRPANVHVAVKPNLEEMLALAAGLASKSRE